MIKIDTTKIEKWNWIKDVHKQYFKQKVLPKCKEINDEIWEKVFKRDKSNVLKLATYKLDELYEIRKDYTDFLEKKKNGMSDEKWNEYKKDIKEELCKVFNYKSFSTESNVKFKGKDIKWGRHKLLFNMGISTCPYCNRQYIGNYNTENDYNNINEKTTADLDHFYSRNKYPFLALSLYNFVPSCHLCNSSFKGDNVKSENLIYPYEEEFGDNAKFTLEAKSIDYLLNMSDDFNIKFKVNDESNISKKIEYSIKKFKLEDVYKMHKNRVIDIIKKSVIYNDDNINNILNDYPEFFDSREEVYRNIMFNFNIDELGNKPLSKLTKDICEELGIEFK